MSLLEWDVFVIFVASSGVLWVSLAADRSRKIAKSKLDCNMQQDATSANPDSEHIICSIIYYRDLPIACLMSFTKRSLAK